jgi:hypothetical protein
MARIYLNKTNSQPKQRVYISGQKAGQAPQKQRIYVSGTQAGQIAQPKILQPPKTGFSGLAQNAKTDFGSFAKGILGLGRQAITHPIDTGQKIGGIGKEIVKGIPGAIGSIGHDIANFGDTTRKGIDAFKQLSQIPLDKQKEMLATEIQKMSESQQAKDNPNQRRLAQLGAGLLGNYSQYSRFKEKVYAEPFSFALDVIPALKAAGAGKLITGVSKAANKIPVVSKATETVSDMFTPLGKLKRLDSNLAEDVAKTGTNMRKSQEGIIKSTVKKFDDLGLSKAEKTEMFETIDKGRRTPGYVPVSTNPKVQKAIDWYIKEELPRIKKSSGIIEQRAGVKEGLGSQLAELQTKKIREILKPVRSKKPKTTIEKIEATTGIKSPRETKTIESLKIREDNLADILQDYKNNPEGIQNYLHHFFNPTSETRMGGKLNSPQRGFLKKSKDVEGYSKDPVVSIAGVKSKIATANIKQGFIDRVTKKYAKPSETVTEFKNGTILSKDTGEPLIKWKGQYLPKEIGEELLKYEGKSQNVMDKLLTPLRAFNRNWKPLATAVRPRYHLRNIIGNVYNASFVGGANPLRYGTALAQQVKGHIAQNMKDGTIAGQVYKALFKQAPNHKYIKMAAEDDVIGRGFFAADINDLAEVANTAEDFAKAISRLENPAEIYRIPILRQWLQGSSRVGQAFEDNARLALYIDQLKKGVSRAGAKAYVNKHLFDYLNGLGEADKAIKAFIPFWSWTRFNVPLQYGALVKNPLRHLAVQEGGKPWVQQQEQNNPEYKYLSQREKDMGAVKTGEETKDGTVYDKYMRTQGVLPIQDISKVLDPENAGLNPMFGMLKQGYNMINPPVNPQENMDYFGNPVEQYPGEVKRFLGMPVRGTAKEILQGIPAISEVNKGFGGSYTTEKRPSGSSRLETVLSPTSSTLQDREKNKRYAESDFGTLVKGDFAPGLESNFKYVIKGLLDNPTDKVLNRNKNTLIDLLKQQNYTDEGIKILIKKSIESVIKDKATIDMPGRQKNITNQEEVKKILEKANKLQPFYQ